MVYSVDMLLEENYLQPTEITKSKHDQIHEDTSFFSMALQFVDEMSTEYRNASIMLYHNILLAEDSQEYIHEAFEGFGATIKKIIDKFIEFIKRIAAKFNLLMHKLVKSDKYLKEHKKDFYKFADTFEMNCYKYTYLDDDTFPPVNPEEQFNAIAPEKIMLIGSEAKSDYSAENILKGLSTTYSNLTSNLGEWQGKFRNYIITGEKGTELTQSEYEKELFEKFRDGSSSTTKIEVGSAEVEEALDRFLNYDKTIKAIEDTRKKLEKGYREIKQNMKQLESEGVLDAVFDQNQDYAANKSTITSALTSDEKIKNKVDQINKLRISRIESMCSIHSLAFAKKLDAAKEAYKQDKRVLYTTLKKVLKNKENKFGESYESLDPVICEGRDFIIERFSEIMDMETTLIQEMSNQRSIINYITECSAIERNDVNALYAVNESAIDSIKKFFAKIIEAAKKMFGKFTTKMSGLFTTDKTWLEKYKDVILKKDFKDRSVTIYDYKPDKLNTIKVPQFTSNVFDELLEVSEEDFQKEFIAKHSTSLPGLKPESADTIKEQIINAIRGGDEMVETSLPSLNGERLKMYTFCVKYDTTIANLEKDRSILETNSSTMNGYLAKELREYEKAPADSETKGGPVDANESALFEAEANKMNVGKINKDSDTNSDSNGKGTATVGKLDNTVAQGSAKAAVDKAKTGAVTDDGSVNKANASNKVEEYQEASRRYFRAGIQICEAKLEAAAAIYKDYMKILRIHVSDYGGSAKPGSGDNDARRGTHPAKQIEFEGNPYRLEYWNDYEGQILPPEKKGGLFGIFNKKSQKVEPLKSDGGLKAAIDDAAESLKGSAVDSKDLFKFNGDFIVKNGNDWVMGGGKKKAQKPAEPQPVENENK